MKVKCWSKKSKLLIFVQYIFINGVHRHTFNQTLFLMLNIFSTSLKQEMLVAKYLRALPSEQQGADRPPATTLTKEWSFTSQQIEKKQYIGMASELPSIDNNDWSVYELIIVQMNAEEETTCFPWRLCYCCCLRKSPKAQLPKKSIWFHLLNAILASIVVRCAYIESRLLFSHQK